MAKRAAPDWQALYEQHGRGWLPQVELFETGDPIRGFVGAMIVPTFGMGGGMEPSPAGPAFSYFEDYAAASRILGHRTHPIGESIEGKRYLRAGISDRNHMLPILDFTAGGGTSGHPVARVATWFPLERLHEIVQAVERWHRRFEEGE